MQLYFQEQIKDNQRRMVQTQESISSDVSERKQLKDSTNVLEEENVS